MPFKVFFQAVFTISSLLGASTLADDRNQEWMTAPEVMSRMGDAYKTCKSYADKGVVSTIFIDGSGNRRTVEKQFTTAFVRPDRFRFQYTENEGRRKDLYIVWRP